MIGAAIKKDVQLLVRDRGRLLSLFLLPVVFMFVFGMMFRFGPDKGTPRPIAFMGRPKFFASAFPAPTYPSFAKAGAY